MTTAAERLTSGYYNSDPVSEANPGGFGDGGHVANFPLALDDVAEVATGVASAVAAETMASLTLLVTQAQGAANGAAAAVAGQLAADKAASQAARTGSETAQAAAEAAAATTTNKATGSAGKNLFNKATAVIGSRMSETGAVTVDATYDYSALIAVTPGTTYTLRGQNANARFTTFYNAAGVVVAGGSNTAVTTFTVPVGVAFIRATLLHTDLATFQMEIGSAATAYEAWTTTIFLAPTAVRSRSLPGSVLADASLGYNKPTFFSTGKNLFNKYAATVGAFIGNTGGDPGANASLDLSTFIAVTAGQTYYARGAIKGLRFTTYYDADRAFVPGGLSSVDGSTMSFVAPAGAAFVRITLFHSDLDTFQLEVGSVATAFEAFVLKLVGADGTPILPTYPAGGLSGAALMANSVSGSALIAGSVGPSKTSFIVQGKNLFDKSTAVIGSFMSPTGAPTVNASFDYSALIPVTAGLTYYGQSNAGGMRFTTYYDAAGAVVAGGGNSADVSLKTFVVPAGVAFLRVTIPHAGLDSFQFEQSAAATAYEAYGFKFTINVLGLNASAAVSGWNGLTWATLGDSITAQGNWQGAVTTALGLMHTNFGIAGTKLSGPAGDANAMCQDARINAIATIFALITLMAGTNDWAQNVPLGAEDSTDPTTFNGALNTWAAKAFARWPDKRLAVVTTPYGELTDWASKSGWTSPARNALGLTTNDYAGAIRKGCERLNLHCIDVARSAGYGATNITTAMGGSTSDHLHFTAGSPAAKGVSAVYRGALRQIEPIV